MKKILLLALITSMLFILQNGCNSKNKKKENSQEQEEPNFQQRELPPAINR